MSDIFDTRFEGKAIELKDNKIKLGDDLNMTAMDQTLSKLHVGAGWELNAFDSDVLDLDMSIFMLDKTGKTRIDEDFIFYNQMEAFGGAIKHNGDSRSGAGDGDDESILIDLHGIPFDIIQLMIVISIYKGDEKEQRLGQVRNAYVRISNGDSMHEIARYYMDEDLEDKNETAVLAAVINREGPKWHFKPIAEFVPGGLREVAMRYGLTILSQ